MLKEEKTQKYGLCHKEDILTTHGPHKRKCDTTYPFSYLNQGTCLTNKHSHFKEMRITQNNN